MERLSREVQRMNHLWRGIEDLYHEIGLKLGLSDSAFLILYEVGALGDGCLQKDICEQACISKQTVHSSIRKLEQKGYLYLKPGKRKDKQIFLTDAGKQLVQEKIYPVFAMENAVFEALGLENSRAFLRLNESYLENLHRLAGQMIDGMIQKEC